NEEYQSLLRLDGAQLRSRLTAAPPADAGASPSRRGASRAREKASSDAAAIATVLADVPDAGLPALIADLGGHAFAERIAAAAARLADAPAAAAPPIAPEHVPAALGQRPLPVTSSQDAFGRLLPLLADLPEVGARVVTASPDVAVSTGLGSWINRVGVFVTLE